jgi:hypothetical protein
MIQKPINKAMDMEGIKVADDAISFEFFDKGWNAFAEYLFRELEKVCVKDGYDEQGIIEAYVSWEDVVEIFGREGDE